MIAFKRNTSYKNLTPHHTLDTNTDFETIINTLSQQQNLHIRNEIKVVNDLDLKTIKH